MPFTLAHPAAVLPLKRFCPRHLSFVGLVVGSIVPDAAYLSGRFRLDDFSHSFVGSFGFSLPAGMLMLALFFGMRRRVVEWLPNTQRQILVPLCLQPVPSILVLAVSVLLGAWTHLFWDSFTHTNGWLVQRLPLLQFEILKLGPHRLMLCHLLWYLSSFVGVTWLCFAYQRWLQNANPADLRPPVYAHVRDALFVGLLVLPIEALHHLTHASIGLVLVGLCSMALVIGVILGSGNSLPARSQKEM